MYAGHETKAMLNNTGPRSKRSLLEQSMNREVGILWLVLFVLCFCGAIGNGTWTRYHIPDWTVCHVLIC